MTIIINYHSGIYFNIVKLFPFTDSLVSPGETFRSVDNCLRILELWVRSFIYSLTHITTHQKSSVWSRKPFKMPCVTTSNGLTKYIKIVCIFHRLIPRNNTRTEFSRKTLTKTMLTCVFPFQYWYYSLDNFTGYWGIIWNARSATPFENWNWSNFQSSGNL